MGINCKEFYDFLGERGVEFFSGVPDSLLKDFNSFLIENVDKNRHVIAANEGNAVALGSGHHLASGKIPLVYMQNSGQGNAVNPLTSLADEDVYGIPMILLIGWRGEPGVKDEPQHVKQGKITLTLLETLGIDYCVLSENWKEETGDLIQKAVEKSRPCAIVVKKGIFEKYGNGSEDDEKYELTREKALEIVASKLKEEDVVVSTTGKLSRELFEYRKSKGQGHEKDFMSVGSMGHVSSIGLGISLAKPDKNVYCLDGDGSLLMHLGSLALIGEKKPKRFRHIVFNNGAHDSVGGQPSAGFDIDFVKVAEGCGYSSAKRAESEEEIVNALDSMNEGPDLLEIRIKKGSRDDLGRPDLSPKENKKNFMENLKNE